MREVAALTPGPYLHIGGDEALSTDPADYRFFVERVQRIVRAHGKRMVGWEEVARARLRRTSVVQHWHDAGLARRAVEQGAKLVLSPATRTYLDMKYTPSSALGLSWAGTTDVRQAYDWDPATLLDGVSERDLLGIEAALWSETIDDRAGLDHLAFPRLLGHAELGWSPAEGRAWRDYRLRLAAHGARLGARGVGFHAAPGDSVDLLRTKAREPGRRVRTCPCNTLLQASNRLPVIEPRPVFRRASGQAPQ